jgi:hypothetical protein
VVHRLAVVHELQHSTARHAEGYHH